MGATVWLVDTDNNLTTLTTSGYRTKVAVTRTKATPAVLRTKAPTVTSSIESIAKQVSLLKALNDSNASSTEVSSSCPYDFRVYVYDIPTSLGSVRISFEARKNKTLQVCKKCNLEQYALEYIVHDFFTQFCGRTRDPEAADFFYLPIVRDAEFRIAFEHNDRRPSLTEQALLEILEKVSGYAIVAH
jgi:hypothetical protein